VQTISPVPPKEHMKSRHWVENLPMPDGDGENRQVPAASVAIETRFSAQWSALIVKFFGLTYGAPV